MKNKKFSFEKLFYNNKFLFVFSLLLAIALWTAVKVNFSGETTRTISDVKVTLDSTLAQVNDFVAFVSEEDLHVDVNVTGKSYDISSSSFSKSNITIEAVCGYVDSAGYKVINLTARSDDTDVSITSIYPSSVTVFFDREITDTFNVEARLDNGTDKLSSGNFVVGQPVASMSTVDVTGPATVVKNIKKVIFEAKLDDKELPLTSTKDVNAKLVYELENERGAQFLKCNSVDDKANPATITIPVSAFKTVSTAVKFVNQPAKYENEPPKVSINPQKVKISYNASEESESNALSVGTIDFRQLTNKLNRFTFTLDESNSANIVDGIDKFNVTIDFSSLSQKNLRQNPKNVVYLNQSDEYDYVIDEEKSNLDEIIIIGPAASLKKLTADDLQVEINVSKLNTNNSLKQKLEVSNISISNSKFKDCWVYGEYTAYVSAVKK